MDAKIVSRIQKLMALSRDGGATEHEAASALAKAQQLMEEHNLSMATVEASGGVTEGGARSKVEGKAKGDDTFGAAQYAWQRNLMTAICKVNFVHCSVRTERMDRGDRTVERKTGYDLIGREVNLIAVANMWKYLNKTVWRLAQEFVGGDSRQMLSKRAIAFQEGCADRLNVRLTLRHEEYLADQKRKANEANAAARHPASASGNALVVVMEDFAQSEEDLNNDFSRGYPPGTTAARRRERAAEMAEFKAKNVARAEAARAAGESEDVVRVMEYGYSLEDAREYVERSAREADKPETEAERAKRRKAEERWYQQNQKRNAKRDPTAYAAGSRAGDSVSLDDQVEASKARIGRS